MQPSDRDYDLLADRLAEDISTDEQQLEELGAEVFTSAKLIELRGRYRERLENMELWQGSLVRIAIWSPLSLALGALLLWLGVFRMGYLLLVAFPVLLVACLGGIFLQYRHFGPRGRIENWLELIEDELTKRQRNAAQKK